MPMSYSPVGGQFTYGAPAYGFDTDQMEAQQNRLFVGQQNDANRANQMAMARLPIDFAQYKFNTVWPTVQQTLGNFQSGFMQPGGQSGSGPHINAGPIWNQGQIQQQVNQTRAFNDQATNNRIRQMQQQMAGRGMGATSPLSRLLGANMQAQNIGQNAQAGTDIRWNAAQGNATQVLNAQKAQENQYASRMGEDIERRKAYTTGLSGILGALGSFA